MTSRILTVSTALLLGLLAGCGNHGGSSRGAATAAITTANGPSAVPTQTTLAEVHGTLVRVGGVSGDPELAFLADGAAEAIEIEDDAALVAAKALPGRTLTVSGAARTNLTGQTTLTEVVDLSGFQLDEVAATGSVRATRAGLLFETLDGQTYVLTGTLAADLQAQATRAPYRITGNLAKATPKPFPKPAPIRPTPRPTPIQPRPVPPITILPVPGPAPMPIKPAPINPLPICPPPPMPPMPRHAALVVTSWAPTAVCAQRVAGGLLGLAESFRVDDLDGTGAFSYGFKVRIRKGDRQGGGQLIEAARADLAAAVLAADLHNQPQAFRAAFPIFDAPHTTLELWDATGRSKISIQAGAKLPAEVQAVLAAFQQARPTVASFQALAAGAFSRVAKEQVQVIDNDADLMDLWKQIGSQPGSAPPRVDFTRQRVVALFMGRRLSGGFAIEVSSVDRVGDEVQVSVQRTAPAPGAPVTKVITSPFAAVVVDMAGAGELYVDGVRQ